MERVASKDILATRQKDSCMQHSVTSGRLVLIMLTAAHEAMKECLRLYLLYQVSGKCGLWEHAGVSSKKKLLVPTCDQMKNRCGFILNLNILQTWLKSLGGSLEILGVSFPPCPASRWNPAWYSCKPQFPVACYTMRYHTREANLGLVDCWV